MTSYNLSRDMLPEERIDYSTYSVHLSQDGNGHDTVETPLGCAVFQSSIWGQKAGCNTLVEEVNCFQLTWTANQD